MTMSTLPTYVMLLLRSHVVVIATLIQDDCFVVAGTYPST